MNFPSSLQKNLYFAISLIIAPALSFASDKQEEENADPATTKTAIISPLYFHLTHPTSSSFDLLGSEHTLPLESLGQETVLRLKEYGVFIHEVVSSDEPVDLKQAWGTRKNDDEIAKYKESQHYNDLTPEQKDYFRDILTLDLPLSLTLYLHHTTSTHEEAYSEGIDGQLKTFYYAKESVKRIALFTPKEQLQRLAFLGDMKWTEVIGGKDDVDTPYPSTLEEVRANLVKDALDTPKQAEYFRADDSLLTAKIIALFKETPKAYCGEILVCVGLDHLPHIIDLFCSPQHGYKVERITD